MADRAIRIKNIRTDMGILLEEIRTEIFEQPFQRMSAADVHCLNEIVHGLQRNLTELIEQLDGVGRDRLRAVPARCELLPR
ncbi:hypothetical protein FIU28_16725 [Tardiphaga sp. vice154]|uniref:hypothetical protein n=1 Tax=Tardiphaga sp. vice154 TaxID=2592814 RepID=UPI0011653B53|nr:hypothetical protein [Tardiphaga sp. vice154]QDM22614.1 hypothetical protein FIU28_16725 [Tardiphaga sp. vice154]